MQSLIVRARDLQLDYLLTYDEKLGLGLLCGAVGEVRQLGLNYTWNPDLL